MKNKKLCNGTSTLDESLSQRTPGLLNIGQDPFGAKYILRANQHLLSIRYVLVAS